MATGIRAFQSRTPDGAQRRGTLALVLAGGHGTRLAELTLWQAKPAIPFGGIYRNIDFTLSNCVNSGLRRIAVLTQYKSQSLIEHLHEGWGFLPRQLGEFIEPWPAQQRVHADWYGGTADAVHQNLDQIRALDPEHLLVLAGDHVYSMDYRPMLLQHADTRADVTIACVEMPRDEAADQFGVLELTEQGRIGRFVEKPCAEAIATDSENVLVSMGVYAIRTQFLLDLFAREARDGRHLCDFGRDVLPLALSEGLVSAYRFRDRTGRAPGYWRDVGTIDAYWLAHMELLSLRPRLDLGDPTWPVHTRPSPLPPARIVSAPASSSTVSNTMLSPGCVVTNAVVRSSVLAPGVVIEPGALVEDSVLLPDVVVERGARVHRAVVDRGVRIGPGVVVGEPGADMPQFRVTHNGVTLVHATVAASHRTAGAHQAA